MIRSQESLFLKSFRHVSPSCVLYQVSLGQGGSGVSQPSLSALRPGVQVPGAPPPRWSRPDEPELDTETPETWGAQAV